MQVSKITRRLVFYALGLSLMVPFIAYSQGTVIPSETPSTPLGEWYAGKGDIFVVDTKENTGYLVNQNGSYLKFSVATGQRRVVRYIGRGYDATTPTGYWIASSKEKKGDRITFGKEGTFFRLFKNGRDQTSYGIHAHAYGAKMLSDEVRFKSMGCIIVSSEILSVLEITFALNDGQLPVFTVYGLSNDIVTYSKNMQSMSLENSIRY